MRPLKLMNVRMALALTVLCALATHGSSSVGVRAQESPITLDFESISGITALTNYIDGCCVVPSTARLGTQLQISHGVRFSSAAGYVAVVRLGFGHATSGADGIGGVNASNVLKYSSPVVITFTVPGSPSEPAVTDFVSIRGDQSPNTGSATMEAFDVNGQSIGSVTAPDAWGGLTLSLAIANIHSIRLTQTLSDIAYDDLRFSPPVGSNVAPAANAGGPYLVPEGGSVALDGAGSSDPDPDDTLSYAWDLDSDGVFGETGQDATRGDENGVNPTFTAAELDGPQSRIVRLRVTDAAGASDTDPATVTVNNVAPAVGAVEGPLHPVAVNTTISVNAGFSDPGLSDTHTAVIDWGDGTTSDPAGLTQAAGGGSVSGSHSYLAAGVYTVTLTVTDDDGAAGNAIYQYVVVYDPAAGFVTGAGSIDSPAGAYVAEPLLEGVARFGFVSKYKQGATAPTGNTEFQFHAGDLRFKSTAYEWLVIAGAKAQFKGSGQIDGSGNYGFMLTAVDGDLSGNAPDTFRIKIWDKDNADAVVYDNQKGAAPDASPTTELTSGAIVIHTPNK